eukprot:252878_1
MYWIWLISFYAINKYGESCNRVDAPRVEMGDSSIEWSISKPIGVCEGDTAFTAQGSSKFICENGNVKYKVYNNSNSCSEQSIVKTYSVEAPYFDCSGNAPCEYAYLKVYIPKNFTVDFTPLNCEHNEYSWGNYIVTDTCISIDGNYSKTTCQGNTFTMTQYPNEGCTGQILTSSQIINGCNVNQLYWNYEIRCNFVAPTTSTTPFPTLYTDAPTSQPTGQTSNPTTAQPTEATSYPTTAQPTGITTSPTVVPTDTPTPSPTDEPTQTPLGFPTAASGHSITISVIIVGVSVFFISS